MGRNCSKYPCHSDVTTDLEVAHLKVLKSQHEFSNPKELGCIVSYTQKLEKRTGLKELSGWKVSAIIKV